MAGSRRLQRGAMADCGCFLLRPSVDCHRRRLRHHERWLTASPWTEEHLKGGIPHVACARPPGAPLPSRALKYAQLGMCCILDNARLWPAAEDKWRHRAYLSQQLRAVDCSVLCSPSQSKRFSYWFDASGYSDRVQAGYQAKPYVTTKTMGIDQFLTASQQRNGSSLLYLQQSILQAPNENPTALQPCKGLGPGILSDIQSGIDLPAVKALAEAGGFGLLQRCQLFIGGKAAEGARSILHFDQYDNLFVQISGTKTFILYDPQQTKHLYAYPIHHPLDTRSQVDLNDRDGCTKAYPRLNNAIGHKITLQAGQALFLPCYWWHEVLTEPTDDELTVSVNFWFAATNRLLTPTRPLVPCMQCECARQLEYLISDSLHDQAKLVPTFLCGLLAAIEAEERGGSAYRCAGGIAASECYQERVVWPLRVCCRAARVAAWAGASEWRGNGGIREPICATRVDLRRCAELRLSSILQTRVGCSCGFPGDQRRAASAHGTTIWVSACADNAAGSGHGTAFYAGKQADKAEGRAVRWARGAAAPRTNPWAIDGRRPDGMADARWPSGGKSFERASSSRRSRGAATGPSCRLPAATCTRYNAVGEAECAGRARHVSSVRVPTARFTSTRGEDLV